MSQPASAQSRGENSNRGEWEFLVSPTEWGSQAVLQRWEQLLAGSRNLNALYQSPEWLGHMLVLEPDQRLAVAVTRDRTGEAVGVIPMCVGRHSLRFHVRGRTLGKIALRQVCLLGSEPLLPPDHGLYDQLLLAIAEAFPDAHCVGMSDVAIESFVWRHLGESRAVQQAFLPYVIDGVREYHVISLPPTYEEYLAQFSRKKRYNLRRQLRFLRDSCQGKLELERIESRGRVQALVEGWVALGSVEWFTPALKTQTPDMSKELRQMADLADRGLLRAYLLKSPQETLGCLIGCQYRDTYVVWHTSYQRNLAALSPGTTMFCLVIEDLLRHRPAKTINLGFGDPGHGHAGRSGMKYASVMLFRKTLLNRLYRASHAGFRSAVRLLRAAMLPSGENPPFANRRG